MGSKWDADDADPKVHVAQRAPVQPIFASEVFAMFQEGAPKALMVRATPFLFRIRGSAARLPRTLHRLLANSFRQGYPVARVGARAPFNPLPPRGRDQYRGALECGGWSEIQLC